MVFVDNHDNQRGHGGGGKPQYWVEKISEKLFLHIFFMHLLLTRYLKLNPFDLLEASNEAIF